MRGRRRFLQVGGLVTLGTLAGCSFRSEQSIPVDVRFLNDDDEEWPVTVTVEREGEVVFQTEQRVPADDGTEQGKVLVEDAFEGTPSDEFEVQVLFDGDPVGTYDFSITCTDDEESEVINVAIENDPRLTVSDPVEFVAYGCP